MCSLVPVHPKGVQWARAIIASNHHHLLLLLQLNCVQFEAYRAARATEVNQRDI